MGVSHGKWKKKKGVLFISISSLLIPFYLFFSELFFLLPNFLDLSNFTES
jgi:hypothetical protein